jgi:lipoprotein-releasing system permease protein
VQVTVSIVKNYLPFWIGLRYTRSSNKQRFLSLLSWVSLLGMMLGVAALIIVLSVMNGFQAELRDRLLNVMAHVRIEAQPLMSAADVVQLQPTLAQFSALKGFAPLIDGEALLSVNNRLRAVELNGISLSVDNSALATGQSMQTSVNNIQQHIVAGDMQAFAEHKYGIVLGAALARALGLTLNDKVSLMLPQLTISPFGARPRIKQFRLMAVFEVGADIDSSMAFIRLEDAQKLYATGDNFQALQLLTDDVLDAENIAQQLQKQLSVEFPGRYQVYSWADEKSQLFAAVKMEKVMVTFMLAVVIAVAAFNLLSVLSMMVAEKRLEIAVLRMMGMTSLQVLLVFFTQGLSLSLVSLFFGGLLGILVASNLTAMVSFVENALGIYIFDPSVFYITGLPSQLQLADVIFVGIFSLVLSALFSLYPAFRATKIQPIEAMQS